MNNSYQDLYNKLHQEGIEVVFRWLEADLPVLWLDLVTRILPKLSDIKCYQQKIKDNEQKIADLDAEIKSAAKVASGRNAVIGSSEKRPWLSNLPEYLFKPGLASVPIVTLFAISGVTSILNPFVNPQQRLGVLFLLWSSVSFVLLTSSGIVKLVDRLSHQQWKYKFWGLTVRSWFAIGCLAFGLIEGLGGGSFASGLIDVATAQANELRETPLPLLDFWGKVKITAIMTLFAYINIFFSIAKGFEVRVLQPHRIRRNQALSKLEIARSERQDLLEKNKELALKIEQLKQEVAFSLPLEEWQRDIRNLSNQITLGQNLSGKHPGIYGQTPKRSSVANNGKVDIKDLDDTNLVSSEQFSEFLDDN